MLMTSNVLITGASSGIGKACVLYLVERGFRVFAGVRKQADADALHDALQKETSGQLTPVFMDVTDTNSIQAAAATVRAALAGAGLHGLVNNAGIALSGPLEFFPIDSLRRQLEINVIGQAAVTQAFLPLLRLEKGRIINMSSLAGRFAWPFFSPYSISKFALEGYSDSLRRELTPWKIPVIVMEPGSVSTPIWGKGAGELVTMSDQLPPEAQPLYGKILNKVNAGMTGFAQRGIPPEQVAEKVHHALTTRRPKTRYLIGTDAQLIARLAWLLPDRAMDWILRRFLS